MLSAILRGAICSGFAHCMAKVDAQSPLEESFGVSTATGGIVPSGSSPAATALRYAASTTRVASARAISYAFMCTLLYLKSLIFTLLNDLNVRFGRYRHLKVMFSHERVVHLDRVVDDEVSAVLADGPQRTACARETYPCG